MRFTSHFHRKQLTLALIFFTSGVFAGYFLWKYDVVTDWRAIADTWPTYRFHERDAVNEVCELTALLRKKLRDLQNANLLIDIGDQSSCTVNQKVKSVCHDQQCPGSMAPLTSLANVFSVRKPVHRVGLENLQIARDAFNLKKTPVKYVFITGASSNHFEESQLVLESFHKTVAPHLTNYSLYYYDFGLSDGERRLVKDYSGAELRTFPFDKFPYHVGIMRCYAWKPLIALAHLPHAEFVVWMDASIIFTDNIQSYFNKSSKTGIVFRANPYQLPQHTSKEMFDYFGDVPCQLSNYSETEGGFQVWHNEEFTRRLLIEPWSACALDKTCMCPVKSRHLMGCDMKTRQYGKCHRFDQSAMGYISAKLFRQYRQTIIIPEEKTEHYVKQDTKGTYLEDLERTANSAS